MRKTNIEKDDIGKTLTKGMIFYPQGQTTVTTGSDNCFHTFRTSVRPSPLSKSKTYFKRKQCIATLETVGPADWIIDDTCLVLKMSNENYWLGILN